MGYGRMGPFMGKGSSRGPITTDTKESFSLIKDTGRELCTGQMVDLGQALGTEASNMVGECTELKMQRRLGSGKTVMPLIGSKRTTNSFPPPKLSLRLNFDRSSL